MRIPWYIYAPLSLLVTFLTLYICVRNVDTVTPPSPEAIQESLNEWREENPSIRDTKLSDTPSSHPISAEVKPKPITPIPPKPKPASQPEPKPQPQPVVKIPAISPALHSLVKQNLTTKQLSSYANHMLKNNKPQLARLAYERIIDCARDANSSDREQAATAISKLISKTPLWNPDPSTRKKLTLSLTINDAYTADIKPLLEQLQQTIFNASDGTVTASIKLTPSSSSVPLCELSIGNHPPIRFSIKNQQDINSKIHQALYFAVRNRNNESQKLTSTPNIPKHISPKQAVQTYLTRLAWVNAAK